MTNVTVSVSNDNASDAFVMSPNVVLEWRGWRQQRIIYCAKVKAMRERQRKLGMDIYKSKKELGDSSPAVKALIAQHNQFHRTHLKQHLNLLDHVEHTLHSLDHKIDAAIDAHARAYHTQLTSAFLARFPREIRDTCYDFLLDAQTARNIGAYMRYQVNAVAAYAHSTDSERRQRDRSVCPPATMHLVHPSYSHPAIASEILALAAKIPVYPPADLCPRYPAQILAILSFDPFGLGVPAGAFYGAIVLRWKRRRALTDAAYPVVHAPEPRVRDGFRALLLAIPSAPKRSLDVDIYAPEAVRDAVRVRNALSDTVAALNRPGAHFMPVDVSLGPGAKKQVHRLERVSGGGGGGAVRQRLGVRSGSWEGFFEFR